MPSPRTVPTDLAQLITDTVALYNGIFTDVRIDQRFAPGVPLVRLDPEQIRRVIINLVDNAIEAMERRGADRRRNAARRRPTASSGSSSPTTARASRRRSARSCSCRTTRPSGAAAASASRSSAASSPSTAAASRSATTRRAARGLQSSCRVEKPEPSDARRSTQRKRCLCGSARALRLTRMKPTDPDRRRRAGRAHRARAACCATRATASRRCRAAKSASSASPAAPFDLIVLDVWLPGMDGLATLARLRERQVDAQVVLISGHGNIESAVRGDQAGRVRLRREAAVAREDRAGRPQRAAPAPARSREPRAARAGRSHQTMVGESYAMRQLREQVAMAAPTNGRVLIYGENGTGKELVARTIHALSRRRSGGLRRGQLRGDPRRADRERAVRPRPRRVHRRGRRSARQVRGRRRRHDLPRRDRRHEPEDAGQGAARAAGTDDGGGRRDDADQGRRARARGDQQGSAGGDPRRPLPRGSLLPPQRHPDLRAAAARPAGGHPAAGRSLHGRFRARIRAPAEELRVGRACRCCSTIRGRATSASCATSSSG